MALPSQFEVSSTRSVQFEVAPTNARLMQEEFETKLQNVQNLNDYVDLLLAQPPGFFTWLYGQTLVPQSPVEKIFETIVDKFRKPALGEIDKPDEFERLMNALPIF